MVDVFEWKPGAFTPNTRVEISADSVIISYGESETTILFANIRRIWFTHFIDVISFFHILHVEIEASDGERIWLQKTGLGFGGDFDLEQARKAAAALFRQCQATGGDVETFLGFRFHPLTLLISLGAVLFSIVLYMFDERPHAFEDWLITAAVALFVVTMVTLAALFTFRTKRVSIGEALEKLASY